MHFGKCQRLQTNANLTQDKDSFENFRKWQANLRSWKKGKGHGKGHGKSWNLKNLKEYKLCTITSSVIASITDWTCVALTDSSKFRAAYRRQWTYKTCTSNVLSNSNKSWSFKYMYSWYHGPIKRLEAEKLLQTAVDCSFLLRNSESSKNDFSLSVR